jgi:hypothetical protein
LDRRKTKQFNLLSRKQDLKMPLNSIFRPIFPI